MDFVEEGEYGKVMISFAFEGAGGVYPYTSITVSSREKLEDLLRKLEGVLQRAYDHPLEVGEERYGPLLAPHEFLEACIASHEAFRKHQEQAEVEQHRKQEEARRQNERTCPQCGQKTTAGQLARYGHCHRCVLTSKAAQEKK